MADLFETPKPKTPPTTPPNTPEPVNEERPTKRRRKFKRTNNNRGDSVHLKEWREYFQSWVSRNEKEVEGKKITERAKLAGIAYRHAKGKKRPSDPPKPEFS